MDVAHRSGLVLWMAMLGFAFLGTPGIWEPDEGRYVAVAANMLTTGDFLDPHLGRDHPHYAKPPLTYWAIAASIAAFGHTEWAARLPSALAYVLTGLTTAMLAAALELSRPKMAAAIWSTTLLPFVGGSIATTDMLLTLFESLAVLGYLRWRTRASQRGLALMWPSFAAAFMTKGPPGLLPLLAIIAFEVSYGRNTRLRTLFPLAPVLAFVAVAFWWFVYILARDPSLWRYFLVNELLDRVATAAHHRNPGWKGLLEAYAPVLLLGTLPFAPVLMWSLFRRKREHGRRLPIAPPTVPPRFLYLWMAVPFAVFAIAQSRLPLYLLPLSVPFALTTALHLEASEVSVRWIRLTALSCAVALMMLRVVAAHWHTEIDARAFATELRAAVDMSNYGEVIFVDSHQPAYGLQFYLGKPVEADPLCLALTDGAAPLIVVPRASTPRYVRAGMQCNRLRLEEMGHVREFALLAAQRQP